MSDFSSYEKMPSSLKKLGLNEKEYAEMEKCQWVVTEKVHGANFSFVYENGQLKFAKRKSYLSWRDDFFGFQLVVNKLETNVLQLFEHLSTHIKASKYIVYGELFGGQYPHPDVLVEPNLQAIQTGVYYSPSIHFCAFDIAIETENLKYYLDYESSISYFERHAIFYTKPLRIGKFKDALEFNTRINSSIPPLLNLPPLKENLIEGIVIKPFDTYEHLVFSSRPIIKLKNKEFDEEDKFHQAEKWAYLPKVSSKSEDLAFVLDELRKYVTSNRLQSAISKIGALDFSNIERVKEIENEFLRDALADFNFNNDNLLGELTKEENEWLSERVKAEVKKLIHALK